MQISTNYVSIALSRWPVQELCVPEKEATFFRLQIGVFIRHADDSKLLS